MRAPLTVTLLTALLAACSQTPTPAPDVTGSTEPLAAQARSTCRLPAMPSVMRAVRFDPSYAYGLGLDATQLSAQLVDAWAREGVNTAYVLVYNPTYGARYRTTYANNVVESWGQQDLLGELLRAAAPRGIQVIAWVYDFRHAGALAANPDWTSRRADGQGYEESFDRAFMTLGSSAAETWYQGFLKDLLTRYPALSGVDFAEPVVNWWGAQADYSAASTAAFQKAYPGQTVGGDSWRTWRAAQLSAHLARSARTVRSLCKRVHVTTTLTAAPDGTLMTPATVARETGFDLNAVLGSADRPDVLNAELIWQQWKAEYGAAVFTPDWTGAATRQALAQVAGRARLAVHVETTPFGAVVPSDADTQAALRAASAAGASALDVYDSTVLDSSSPWASVYAPLTALAR